VKRREFIVLLGGVAAAWPQIGRAQQPQRMRRIGVLLSVTEADPVGDTYLSAFRKGLQHFGLVEGRNIQIDVRRATPDLESICEMAKDLLALQPDLVLSANTPTTAAILQHTRAIPIIFANVADPIGSGFVASYGRPGGNVTGFLTLEETVAGKWIELLKEIAPRVARAVMLYNPGTAPYFENFLGVFKTAAASLAVKPLAAAVRSISELESVLAAQAREANTGIVVIPDTFFIANRVQVTALAVQHRLPSVYPFRVLAEAGGLLSYGNDLVDQYRRAAIYAERILRGEKTGNLPVQVPEKFEFVINLKIAKTLGLDVPGHMLQRATELIE
jgi:putative tryptophan/tyrosine transport system substrate-binding protein